MSTASLTAERRNALDPTREKHRESLVWVVPEPETGLTTFVYTWVNSQGLAGAALAVFGTALEEQIFEIIDGVEVDDGMDFDAWQVGPLSLTLAPDGMTSTVHFDGDRVALELAHSGFHPAYVYGSHPQGCPEFFADNRVEQSGMARGTLRIDERRIQFEAPVQRDHSWGERNWAAMHHMKWVNALTPSGDAVHAVELMAFGQRFLRGYVFLDGEFSPLESLRLHYELDAGLLHTDMDATFTDESGRSVEVSFSDGGPHFAWDVNPRLTLRDTSMRASVRGIDGVAYVDMSWEPEYLRWHSAARKPQLESGSEVR